MERPAHMRLNLKKREAPLPVVQQHEEAPSASSPSAQAHQEGNSDAMKVSLLLVKHSSDLHSPPAALWVLLVPYETDLNTGEEWRW